MLLGCGWVDSGRLSPLLSRNIGIGGLSEHLSSTIFDRCKTGDIPGHEKGVAWLLYRESRRET